MDKLIFYISILLTFFNTPHSHAVATRISTVCEIAFAQQAVFPTDRDVSFYFDVLELIDDDSNDSKDEKHSSNIAIPKKHLLTSFDFRYFFLKNCLYNRYFLSRNLSIFILLRVLRL